MTQRDFDSDGWDQQEEAKEVESYQYRKSLPNYGKPLSILSSNHHSLEPDMVSGWRPKLPSCPLPLSFKNEYVDQLRKKLQGNPNYRVVYNGERLSNSAKMNQKHSYYWKYRSKYSMNVNSIRDAVQNVGRESGVNLPISGVTHTFDSSFECGNLDMVIRVGPNEYDCFLRSDTNTRGHCNWYYFKVENSDLLGSVRINICNLSKSKSLYLQGMKPYCRVGENGEWSQDYTYNVAFFQAYCRYGLPFKNNQLKFSFDFTHPHQTIYFAYSIPYSFSDLQTFVNELKLNEKNYTRITTLCESLGGLELPLITMELNKAKGAKLERVMNRRNHKRKAIIITGRIHPGETHSSLLIQGFVGSLLKDKNLLETILFNRYVILIVPMLNPDGVIAGNYRTSYSGKDLNRQFHQLDKYLFPEIYALKDLYDKCRKEGIEVEYFFDFHTHSSKKSLFCYGPEHLPQSMKYYRAKALARIMSTMGQIFCYRDSIFTISEEKKNTARAFMLKVNQVPMAFTFQVSNGMYMDKLKRSINLTKSVLISAGNLICDGVMRFVNIDLNSCIRTVIKSKINSRFDQRKLSLLKSQYGTGIKQSPNFKSEVDGENSTSVFLKIIDLEECLRKDQKVLPLKDVMMELLNQVKNEEPVYSNYKEGGSDSEDSEEDLKSEETKKLFQIIKNRRKVQQKTLTHVTSFVLESDPYRKREIATQNSVQAQSHSQARIGTSMKKKSSIPKVKSFTRIVRLKKEEKELSKIAVSPKHFTLLI